MRCTMYDWRRMNAEQRREVLAQRQKMRRPWHSPPHRYPTDERCLIFSAACYEHAPIIGYSAERMDQVAETVCTVMESTCTRLYAWCVLPNHYHAVVQTASVKDVLGALGRMHGRLSYAWNGEENQRGRKVWCNALEREVRSEGHLWASINYVHHNPVKHEYVERWQDWTWSSAAAYLETVGDVVARQMWREHPVHNLGAGWDD